MQKVKNEIFCLPCCRSIEHAEEIVTAILRGNEDQALSFMCWRCSNYQGLVDEAGRTALHIASSCGKTKILRWLLKYAENINLRDRESGYTPLHRSMFHGQLNSARYLIMHGAKLDIVDNDGIAALDHPVRDKAEESYIEMKTGISPWKGSSNPLFEVYVWGSNSNFNLGIGNHQIRRQPDTIDYFWRNRISIFKVAMGKFHSLFLSDDGRAYSCGLGQGGRLGLDSEETVMTPNQINVSGNHTLPTSSKQVVISVSVGQDHSLLLTDRGVIYSFGMNDYYQLGLNPPPPFQLSPKALSLVLKQPVGVSAAHYHSVAWSRTDLYTWGYNCGQLGYQTQDQYQLTPKLIPNLRNACISAVASADSATVIVTDKKDIFLLREYGCLKIGSVSAYVCRLEISGGRLDPALIKCADVSGWGDYRMGEDDLKILAVVWEDKTMFWQSSTGQFSRCSFQVGNRFLKVTDAALSSNKLIVVTDKCEAFETDMKIIKSQEKGSLPADPTPLQKLLEKDSPIVFQMTRIGFVYRAFNAFCDPKGLNFAIVQTNPIFLANGPEKIESSGLESDLLSLLEEATESDYVSDVVFSVAGYHIPAHRYIIEKNCGKLASIVNSAEEEHMSSLFQKFNMEVNEDSGSTNRNTVTVKLDNIHPLIFKEILKYIYTGQFDYCTPCDWSSEKDEAYASVLLSNETLRSNNLLNCKSETVDQSSTKDNLPLKKFTAKDKNTSSDKTLTFEYNPVLDARRTANYFELKELEKKLHCIVYNKEKCLTYWKFDQKSSPKEKATRRKADFNRQDSQHLHDESVNEKRKISLNLQFSQHLYDVVIECCEGSVISAHKCVLTMRSKYFDTMLKGNWLECNERRNLYLPFSYDVVEAILTYIYEDKVPFSTNMEDVLFICNVLVAADHILVDGLKLMCEISLAHLLTLKNVSELYKFSDTYSASRLRRYCLQFIVPNISALLETRALDNLDDDLFTDIQLTYWGKTPVVLERSISIPNRYPDLEQLQSILENVGVPSEEEHKYEHQFKSQAKKEGIDTPKKRKPGKRHKLKKSSIDESVELMGKLPFDSSHNENLGATSDTLQAAMSPNTPDEESANFSQDCTVEDKFWIDPESKSKETSSSLIPYEKSLSADSSKPKMLVSPQIEKDFPSLTGKDMHQPSLTSSAKVPKQRMAKLSQKARKKLLASASISDEPQDNPSESIIEFNVWKKSNSDTQEETLATGLQVLSLSDIMNEERLRCPRHQRTSFRESFSEDNSSSPAPSSGAIRKWSSRIPNHESKDQDQKPFDEIMADELKQREMTKKIMEKSLDLTQIEDKAIKELQLLYDEQYGFEEYITVKRSSSAHASKPVWRTSKTS